MYLNFWALFFARMLLGVSAGAMIVASSIYLKETVPASKLSFYGTSVNFGIVFGLLVSITFQGLILPDPGDTVADETSHSWRYVMGAPVVICITNAIFWLIVLRFDSIDYCIEQENFKDAK